MGRTFFRILAVFWIVTLVNAIGVAFVYDRHARQTQGEWLSEEAERWSTLAASLAETDLELANTFVGRRERGPIRTALIPVDEALNSSVEPVSSVTSRAQQEQGAAWLIGGQQDLHARLVDGADGEHYVVVSRVIRPSIWQRVRGRSPLTGRVISLLLLSASASWLLAWYFTRPLRQLRTTARSLAGGDLSARVDPAVARRRDEFGELAREFDDMAQRIETHDVRQQTLMADISHELRSPLARLNVALELARSSPTVDKALARAERESDRMDTLIGEILRFASLRRMEQVAVQERVDLDTLIDEVIEDAEFEAQAFGRSVARVGARAPEITGSKEMLRSALDNVIRNAITHTPEGSTIVVDVSGTPEMTTIEVRDEGQGVPSELLDQIFTPFFRVDAHRNRASGGSGLGLAIAAAGISLHGGTISASNRAPNGALDRASEDHESGGLTVAIRLPRTLGKDGA